MSYQEVESRYRQLRGEGDDVAQAVYKLIEETQSPGMIIMVLHYVEGLPAGEAKRLFIRVSGIDYDPSRF